MAPCWLTLYLDIAPGEYARAVEFWEGVTGGVLSAPRGDHGEFATLLPPDGDAQVRIQRLAQGTSRVHLDVHVAEDPDVFDAEVQRVVGLGATLVALPGHAVMRSPGGFPLCLVREQLGRPPAPGSWPGGHRSVVDQLCLDIPPAAYDVEAAFWADLLHRDRRPASRPEFERLVGEPWLEILLQRLDSADGPVRGHIDVATDDRQAEVARLVGLGAIVAYHGPDWTTLTPPAGPVLCVTDRDPVH